MKLAFGSWFLPLCLLPGIAAAQLGLIEVGKPFPSLLLPDARDGTPRAVSEYRGQKLVLHVFASW